MTDPLKLIRPNILAMSPYSTARDDYSGGAVSTFLDANESPYDNDVNRYPDPRQRALKARISQIFDLPSESIFIGNGSDEAIDLCFRIFCVPGRDSAVAISPSYGMYSVAAETNDVEFRQVSLRPDFSLDAEALLAAADSSTKLLFICSPNNPTANAFPPEQIKDLCSRFGGMVVLDEAYGDFSGEPSLAGELAGLPNLIILRTLSKAWGMAGLRVGLAFAAPQVITFFDRVKYPYNINVLAQKEALSRLDPSVKQAHVAEILSERERLAKALPGLPGVLKVYPSQANFLLVRFEDPDAVYQKLIEGGVIVRNRSRVPLCEGCLRITVGTERENDILLALLAGEHLPEPGDRHVFLRRKTSETDIRVELDLDRGGRSLVSTGLGFFDHMLMQLPHHGGITLRIEARGDLNVDEHHTIEDTGIALGEALAKALGDKAGTARYGFALPMDESEATVLLDFGGRTDFAWDVSFSREKIGDVPTEMFSHFFSSLCSAARCNLHIKATGTNEHHKAEAIFKAFARALRMAVARSGFPYEIPSSKGVL